MKLFRELQGALEKSGLSNGLMSNPFELIRQNFVFKAKVTSSDYEIICGEIVGIKFNTTRDLSIQVSNTEFRNLQIQHLLWNESTGYWSIVLRANGPTIYSGELQIIESSSDILKAFQINELGSNSED
jgi:hypothetical protein